MGWRVVRRRRVRLHLADPAHGVSLPSVEGILVRRERREYVICVPELHVAPGAAAQALADARELRIPRERVAFYEVLR